MRSTGILEVMGKMLAIWKLNHTTIIRYYKERNNSTFIEMEGKMTFTRGEKYQG